MKLQIGWGIYDFASLDLDLGLVFVILFVTIEWEPESDCRHTHHENEKYISCLYTIYRIRMWWWVVYFRFSVFFVIRIFGFTSGNQFLRNWKIHSEWVVSGSLEVVEEEMAEFRLRDMRWCFSSEERTSNSLCLVDSTEGMSWAPV